MDSQTTVKTTFKDASYLKPKDPTQNRLTDDDTEISIFDARRYFRDDNDGGLKDMLRRQQLQQEPFHDFHSVSRLSSVSSVESYGRNFRIGSFQATPTASSEASWNSQTGLLSNPSDSVSVSLSNLSSDRSSKRSADHGKKWFSFGRKCCCTGKKSVQVKEVTSDSGPRSRSVLVINPERISVDKAAQRTSESTFEIEQDNYVVSRQNQRRGSASGRPFIDSAIGFSFPVLKSPDVFQATNAALIKGIIGKPMVNPVKHQLHELQSVSRVSSMENTVNARGFVYPGSPTARDDDVGSDGSSDLFEIESFSSTPTTLYNAVCNTKDEEDSTYDARRFASSTNGISKIDQYVRRRVDETQTLDWSVAAAEGYDKANFSNVSAVEIGVLRRRMEEAGGEDGGKRNGDELMLMSCRQEKAASVGPHPVKCVVAEGATNFPLPAGGRPPRANKPPLVSSDPGPAGLPVAFAA
ncbi:protein PHYTOCHROME KINASE SUBSTRATE 4 [Sesamum indicum]|uniref:Protein PHYTOCHROME KINASE SUBSTRATE 4 n=1 Tax=Sesamum indicum TaxID=4182 RepID=A0A6I9TET2_SESIN|nr:protein PHYTOCHROME KINASE SUBSTRATE 4 [Sesamum indicum]